MQDGTEMRKTELLPSVGFCVEACELPAHMAKLSRVRAQLLRTWAVGGDALQLRGDGTCVWRGIAIAECVLPRRRGR